jgi:hypothetical protein
MTSTEFVDELDELVHRGILRPEEAYAAVREASRRENVDPYEGTYLDGPPADAWEHLNDRVWFVNEYETSREYMGAEEGGWWSNINHPVGIAAGPFRFPEDALEVEGHLTAFAEVTNRSMNPRGLSGWGAQAEARYRVETCVPHAPVYPVYC